MPDRRTFLLGSGATVAADSLLASDACSALPVAPDISLATPVHTLTPVYATHELLGYKVHTRTYGGDWGPTIETAPGQRLS